MRPNFEGIALIETGSLANHRKWSRETACTSPIRFPRPCSQALVIWSMELAHLDLANSTALTRHRGPRTVPPFGLRACTFSVSL
jgi:hypothetical protein